MSRVPQVRQAKAADVLVASGALTAQGNPGALQLHGAYHNFTRRKIATRCPKNKALTSRCCTWCVPVPPGAAFLYTGTRVLTQKQKQKERNTCVFVDALSPAVRFGTVITGGGCATTTLAKCTGQARSRHDTFRDCHDNDCPAWLCTSPRLTTVWLEGGGAAAALAAAWQRRGSGSGAVSLYRAGMPGSVHRHGHALKKSRRTPPPRSELYRAVLRSSHRWASDTLMRTWTRELGKRARGRVRPEAGK